MKNTKFFEKTSAAYCRKVVCTLNIRCALVVDIAKAGVRRITIINPPL
jgi:hypothetical protein